MGPPHSPPRAGNREKGTPPSPPRTPPQMVQGGRRDPPHPNGGMNLPGSPPKCDRDPPPECWGRVKVGKGPPGTPLKCSKVGEGPPSIRDGTEPPTSVPEGEKGPPAPPATPRPKMFQGGEKGPPATPQAHSGFYMSVLIYFYLFIHLPPKVRARVGRAGAARGVSPSSFLPRFFPQGGLGMFFPPPQVVTGQLGGLWVCPPLHLQDRKSVV